MRITCPSCTLDKVPYHGAYHGAHDLYVRRKGAWFALYVYNIQEQCYRLKDGFERAAEETLYCDGPSNHPPLPDGMFHVEADGRRIVLADHHRMEALL